VSISPLSNRVTVPHCAQLRELMVKIRGSTTKVADKLRLAILYILRYEEQANISQIKQELVDGGVAQDKVLLIDQLIRFAGKVLASLESGSPCSLVVQLCLHRQEKRTPGLYGGRTFIARMAKNLQSGLAGVENVYTQHVPLLMSTIDAAAKNKLKPQHYPAVGGGSGGPVSSVIVFVLGGVTFEEALKVHELNNSNSPYSVILGGTAIHNSTTFLAELRQM
jgi:vacuolar protein sorting-associated protein 45